MEKLFDLEIISPVSVLFKSQVKHIRLPGIEGSFGILAGHMPLVTTLVPGEIKIDLDSENTKYFATSGGIVEVLPTKTKILIETAEEAKEIDLERAIYAKERAERRLSEKPTGTDFERAKKALIRANTRIRILKKIRSGKK